MYVSSHALLRSKLPSALSYLCLLAGSRCCVTACCSSHAHSPVAGSSGSIFRSGNSISPNMHRASWTTKRSKRSDWIHRAKPDRCEAQLLTGLQLIKKLSATPVIPALNDHGHDGGQQEPQKALQANKATFFFRVVSRSNSLLSYVCL